MSQPDIYQSNFQSSQKTRLPNQIFSQDFSSSPNINYSKFVFKPLQKDLCQIATARNYYTQNSFTNEIFSHRKTVQKNAKCKSQQFNNTVGDNPIPTTTTVTLRSTSIQETIQHNKKFSDLFSLTKEEKNAKIKNLQQNFQNSNNLFVKQEQLIEKLKAQNDQVKQNLQLGAINLNSERVKTDTQSIINDDSIYFNLFKMMEKLDQKVVQEFLKKSNIPDQTQEGLLLDTCNIFDEFLPSILRKLIINDSTLGMICNSLYLLIIFVLDRTYYNIKEKLGSEIKKVSDKIKFDQESAEKKIIDLERSIKFYKASILTQKQSYQMMENKMREEIQNLRLDNYELEQKIQEICSLDSADTDMNYLALKLKEFKLAIQQFERQQEDTEITIKSNMSNIGQAIVERKTQLQSLSGQVKTIFQIYNPYEFYPMDIWAEHPFISLLSIEHFNRLKTGSNNKGSNQQSKSPQSFQKVQRRSQIFNVVQFSNSLKEQQSKSNQVEQIIVQFWKSLSIDQVISSNVAELFIKNLMQKYYPNNMIDASGKLFEIVLWLETNSANNESASPIMKKRFTDTNGALAQFFARIFGLFQLEQLTLDQIEILKFIEHSVEYQEPNNDLSSNNNSQNEQIQHQGKDYTSNAVLTQQVILNEQLEYLIDLITDNDKIVSDSIKTELQYEYKSGYEQGIDLKKSHQTCSLAFLLNLIADKLQKLQIDQNNYYIHNCFSALQNFNKQQSSIQHFNNNNSNDSSIIMMLQSQEVAHLCEQCNINKNVYSNYCLHNYFEQLKDMQQKIIQKQGLLSNQSSGGAQGIDNKIKISNIYSILNEQDLNFDIILKLMQDCFKNLLKISRLNIQVCNKQFKRKAQYDTTPFKFTEDYTIHENQKGSGKQVRVRDSIKKSDQIKLDLKQKGKNKLKVQIPSKSTSNSKMTSTQNSPRKSQISPQKSQTSNQNNFGSMQDISEQGPSNRLILITNRVQQQ